MNGKRRIKLFRSGLILLFLFLMSPFQQVFAAFEDLAKGARPAGFAGAFVAVPGFAESLLVNPAALAVLNGITVHLFYTKPLGLAEMQQGNAVVIFPFLKKSFGFGAQSFGNDKYGENTFYAGFSAPIFKNLFFGSTVRYANLNISGYGSAATFIVDFGAWAKLTPSVFWGTSIKNIAGAKIGRSGEELPQLMTTGFMFSPLSQISVTFDLNKDTRFPLDIRSGVEYRPLKRLALRAGVAAEPQIFAAGFSVKFKNLRIDYAFTNHSELGFTHLFSLTLIKSQRRIRKQKK
ncbi:MAG: hypothetical protein GWP06_03635 [Actinobacteria bacterium]|nr:hypothetical protein [Actinomycetota bacterium]